jgi:L,D-transpeptidase catalytic domain
MLMLASSSSSPRHRDSIERGVDGGDHRVIGGLATEMCGDRPQEMIALSDRPRGRRAAEQRDELAPPHVTAARKNGQDGRRPRVRSGDSARFRTMSKAVQAIQWVRVRSTYTRAARTPLYRIHGTNQPGWIGHAISSGCIRLTNEDVATASRKVA